MSDHNEPSYEVGYGKPPKHSQFKKGQSGNPKGRPKGAKNFSTLVKDTFQQKIKVKVDGHQKTVSRADAIMQRLAQKALSGDSKALGEVIRLLGSYCDEPEADSGPSAQQDDELKAVLQDHVRLLQAAELDGQDDDDAT